MPTGKPHLTSKRPVANVRSIVSDASAGPAFVDGRQCPSTHKDSK